MNGDVTILPYGGISPDIADDAFVAPGCRLIGDLHIGSQSSIWYNCVVRADVHSIRIGARTNIQDGSIVHVTTDRHSVTIGDDCLVGHMVVLHGCILEDRAFVGLGAIVMDACVVESDGMLAAGAMLTPGKRVGARQLWGGRPARYMRDLRDDEIAANHDTARHYMDLAREHAALTAGLPPRP